MQLSSSFGRAGFVCLATLGEGVMSAFRYDFLGYFSDKPTFDNEYLN